MRERLLLAQDISSPERHGRLTQTPKRQSRAVYAFNKYYSTFYCKNNEKYYFFEEIF